MDQEQGREFVTPDIERRQYRRVNLVTQIKCESLGREELLATRDVSVGGLFVKVRKPLPRDSEVTLTFRLPSTQQSIACRGKVMYPVEGLGMGVQFFDLSPETRGLLQKFVDESA